MTCPFQPTTASSPWLCNLSMPHTATPTVPLPLIISLWASVNYQHSAQSHHIQSRALRESQLSENWISHLWFEVQKPVSPREKFRSSLPFLTEQFPAPVQGIQISVIIPDTTNQFFPFYSLLCCLCLSAKVNRDCARQQKKWEQMERSAEGGWTNWQPWLGWRLPYEVTSNDNATDAQWKGWRGLIHLDCWDKSGLLLTSVKFSNFHVGAPVWLLPFYVISFVIAPIKYVVSVFILQNRTFVFL